MISTHLKVYSSAAKWQGAAAIALALLSFFVPAVSVADSAGQPYPVYWYLQFGSWAVVVFWLAAGALHFLPPKKASVTSLVHWVAVSISIIFLLHQSYGCLQQKAITAHAGIWLLWLATLWRVGQLLATRRVYGR